MKKNIFCIWLVFTLCINFVSAQQKCDCPSFTTEVKVKFDKANRSGKYDEARVLIAEQKKSSDLCCQAIGFAMESIVFNSEGKTDEIYTSATKALKLVEGKYNTFTSIEGNRMLGIYYNRKGNTDSSILFYFKSLEFASKENDHYSEAKLYSNISLVYINQKEYDRGLAFIKKSVDASLASKDTSAIAQAYANMVTIYGELYDATDKIAYLDTSEQYSATALMYAKASKNPITIIRNYLSKTKFSLAKENYVQALTYSDTLLTLVDEKTNPAILNSLYIDRGAAYLGLKQNAAAIEYLTKAFGYARQVKNLHMEKMMYGKLYEAYKANGETAHALENLEKYKEMSDSLINKENAEVINEMEGKYNQAKNETTIKDLDKKKQFYFFLAIAGLLAALAIGFFLRQQSLKHKKNILETEQRLNRARMNPHFFFNALTALQKFALKENNGQAMASNLSKFSNIMRETLESTYKEYVTIEQEIEFLNEYLEVQKIRFPQTFSYEVSAAKELEIDELLIPAMIIQPFVENSIEHGFAGVDYPGRVSVLFKQEGKDLLINITDNGKGLITTVKENNEHISRASQIIKDRIYLLNIKLKTKAGFSIDNDASGKGVVVKINLPLLYKNQTNS
jgi:two-component sensor histidine kinase